MNFRRKWLAALVFLLGAGAGNTASLYEEQGQLVRAPRALGMLGENLFGDEVNYFNGSLSFSQTDVSLPGNNALPMTITRRFSAGDNISTVGHFGHWELDIPHMHGMFSAAKGTGNVVGWVVPLYSWTKSQQNRCSSFGAPPDSGGAFGSLADFSAEEFWHGNHLSIPGVGSQEVVLRTGYDPRSGTNGSVANLNYPADGYQYPLVTKNLWAIRCLPTLSGGLGEGFLAVSPDGTQYQFDWLVSRPTKSLTKGNIAPQLAGQATTKPASGAAGTAATGTTSTGSTATPPGNDPSGAVVAIPVPTEDDPTASADNILPRQEVWIMPTLVTDKFGNTIRYVWDTQDPWKLLQMLASDGRQFTFAYVTGTHLINSISDGTRTWTYNYANIGSAQYPQYSLGEVVNPDNSRWQLAGIDPLARSISYGAGSPGCDNPGTPMDNVLVGNMTHPSGAVGTFALRPVLHGRTGVVRDCREVGYAGSNFMEIGFNPRYFHTNSLVQKNITGPGLPTMGWTVNYGPANAGWSDCTTCVETKTVIVTDPRGDNTRYIFGNRYNVNEGLLLQTDYGFDGNAGLRSVLQKYRAINAGPYVNPVGISEQTRGDAEMSARMMPVEQRITIQQGTTFTWQANTFDAKGRATNVTRSSTLGFGRTEQTAYQDIANKWVLGLVASVTETNTGLVMQANTYDPANGNLLTSSHFGKLDETRTYFSDGTLKTKTDGANHTTNFANYKRGLAQNVSYADYAGESALVNDIGLITSTTDAAGFTTTYGYDAAGRLSRITYPVGDSVAWNDTTITTEQVGNAEYGIPAMHWRQTVSTGNARQISYLDAFWRPVISRTYDTAAESTTSKMVLRQFDHKDKTTFESFPQRFISSVGAALTGTATQYDALARPNKTVLDSELGKLTTSIEYLSSFQKRVTNPRTFATTYSYQAFDEPNEGALIRSVGPYVLAVDIERDLFGKPKRITRGADWQKLSRSYVYDNAQRLCKTIEPETGATVQDYDAANNVAWRASGLTLPSTTTCDTASVPANKKINYGYDLRNRLTSTTYSDGSPAITRTYTPDGLPFTNTSNGAAWTNTYNKRRLLSKESLSYGGKIYNIGYGFNANASPNQLTYPDAAATTVAYNPNALGEPSQVGSFATSIAYYPNGAISGFTYGNGISHSMQQNVRGLPQRSIDAGVLDDVYSYDENGNVVGITDGLDGIGTRTMGYDALDRLYFANAPALWGNANFQNDALDNITSTSINKGSTARASSHSYDPATNRLTNITSNNAQYSFNYGYDAQGNVTQRGTQAYVFDQGNRLASVTGKASYVYDGLGHRVKISKPDGSTQIQVYSQAGQLLYGTSVVGSGPVTESKYVYLSGTLLTEAGVAYTHTDALGSPVARTNAAKTILSRTRYEPYGLTAAGVQPTIGFTGHVNDADTGLINMQQRYYDPVAARFLSVDPVVTDNNTGGSFNRYAYANNNPFKYIDPDGRDPDTVYNWGPNYGSRQYSNPNSLIGEPAFLNPKGEIQCVELIKQTVGDNKSTQTWRQGAQVDANTPAGTAIGTFNKDGKFDSNNTGQHAALLAKPADKNGTIVVVDQYAPRERNNKPVTTVESRTIMGKNPVSNSPSNNGKKYNVILFEGDNKKQKDDKGKK